MTPFHKLRKVPRIGQQMMVVCFGKVFSGTFDSLSAGNDGRFILRTDDHRIVFPPTAVVRVGA